MHRLNYQQKDLGKSFALAVCIMISASLILGLIFGSDAQGFAFWLMQGLYTLLIGGGALLYAYITKTNFVTATKLNKAPSWKHFGWGCLAVVFLIASMQPLNNWILDGIEAIGLNRPAVNFDDSLAGLLIVACLFPCFTEEVVFRGTIAQSLYYSRNKWGAVAISGALFALFHANPAQTLHQFVLGCFLALLVYRSGSLWTSIIVHFFNNALVVALNYTPLGTDEFWNFSTNKGVIITFFVVGIVGFVLCVFGYLTTTASSWQQDDVEQQCNGCERTQQDVLQKASKTQSIVILVGAIAVCALLWIANLLM